MDFTSLEFERHKYRMIIENLDRSNLEDLKKYANQFLDAYFDMKKMYMQEVGKQLLTAPMFNISDDDVTGVTA
jgi:hypothetical protein